MSKSVRGEATRLQIIAAAQRMFAKAGYDGTSIEQVLLECGISKGALYHHFRNKEALFTAVLEALEGRIVETVADATRDAVNPVDALRAGCGAWLDLVVSDDVVRRVAVIEAPAVLGWRTWREIEGRHALGLLENALRIASKQGRFDEKRVQPYAFVLLAALNEMAMFIARSEEKHEALTSARDAVEKVILGLVGAGARER